MQINITVQKFVAFLSLLGVVTCGTHQKRLLKELFEKRMYNVLERPVASDNETLTIALSFSLQQIITLDEKNQFLLSSVWVDHLWTDDGLVWDPADYGNITKIRLAPSAVWKPDILMYNSASDEFDSKSPVNVVVKFDGTVAFIPPAMLKSICKVNIRWFPLDEQFCKMKFGSWTYDEAQVNITYKDPPVAMDSYVENGEWLLVAATVRRNSVKYDCCPEVYPDITVYFHLRRLSLYYYFNLLLPSGLISIMALLVFTLPVDSGEKMGLSVTILLSLTVFMMVVSEKMPRTSEALPLLGIYFTSIMLICSVALLTSVWVLNLHYFPHVNIEPPRWVRYGLCVNLAKFLRMRIPDDLAMEATFECAQRKVLKSQPEFRRHSRSLMMNVLDMDDDEVLLAAEQFESALLRKRMCCGTVSQNGINAFRERRSNHNETDELDVQRTRQDTYCRNSKFSDDTVFTKPVSSDATSPAEDNAVDGGLAQQRGLTPARLQSNLHAILRELRVISGKVKHDDKSEKHRALWRFAARVVDRVCLLLFSVVNVIVTCILLFIAPTLRNADMPSDYPSP